MDRKPQEKIQIAVAICFFFMIIGLSLSLSTKLPFAVKQHFKSMFSSASTAEDVVSSYLLDEFYGKKVFIDLNGLFARLTGRRTYNDTTLLRNGMLSSDKESIETIADMQDISNALTELSQKLQEIETPFLYVQVPYKMDLQEELLPLGMKELWNEQIDSLMESISDNHVMSLDLRHDLANTSEECEKYFYKTDSHWTPDGAFKAFQIIMSWMQNNSRAYIHSAYTSPEYWVRHEKPDWFLGNFGKRVGSCYGGVDSLIWYTPGFDTNMSCSIPNHREILCGDYFDAYIRKQYIEERNLYDYDPYCVYIGGNYPLYRLRNAFAPNQMRILMIQDSFTLPLAPFFSSEFTQIDVIDPRYYTRSSIPEYCAQTQPDVVIMALSPASTTNGHYNTIGKGNAELFKERKNLLTDYSITIPAENSNFNYAEIPVDLTPGKKYIFTVDSLSLLSGEATGVSIMIYDFDNRSIISEEILSMDSIFFRGDNQVFFQIPKDAGTDINYKMLVYAGFMEKTQGVGIQYNGISVDELS